MRDSYKSYLINNIQILPLLNEISNYTTFENILSLNILICNSSRQNSCTYSNYFIDVKIIQQNTHFIMTKFNYLFLLEQLLLVVFM